MKKLKDPNFVLIFEITDEPLVFLSLKQCFRHWPVSLGRKLMKKGARCIGVVAYGEKRMVPFVRPGHTKKILALCPPKLKEKLAALLEFK